jgi:hypothetical protein
MRFVAAILAVVVGCATTAAWALDRPISGAKIVLKRSASGKKALTFTSKSMNVPFPVVDGPDDPSDHGMLIELFSPTEGTASINVPAGSGQSWSWKIGTGTIGQYKFTNSLAPQGVTKARTIVLKQGRLLKISTKDVPFPLTHALGRVGVRVTMGGTRACAMFLPSTVTRDEAGKFNAKNAPATVLPNCDDATMTTPPNACGGADTFNIIQQNIFSAHGCNVGTCHGPFAAANLDLRPGASYAELVNVTPDNPIAGRRRQEARRARRRGGELPLAEAARHDRHAGRRGGEDAARREPLSATELALIDAWINAGAPQNQEVPGAPCLPPVTYTPAPALDPPPGGYQIILNGPVLQPGQEQEGCMWVPVPNATNFDVGKWEFSLNPGTHHFAIFEYTGGGTPQTNVWRAGDVGCISGANFGNNISGSPQAPYYVDAYPPGVARRLVAGKYLGLNAHYYNTFNVAIQIKLYINIYPYSGPTPRLATTIIDLDDTFSIDVPPFISQVHPPAAQPRARWTNTGSLPRNVIFLGGHMHNRGVRFTVWDSNGQKMYESLDWAHPNVRVFSPALVLPPGGYFDYECLYDNGVTRPVRTDGNGQPTHLLFGTSAEDAMCIITGVYYE